MGWRPVVYLAALAAVVLLVTPSPRDDTDPDGGRSGVRLYTDARTGCQYLGAPGGGLTPRLNGAGRHVGCV